MSFGRWPRYVPVAERRAKAEKEAKKRLNNGQKTNPVVISGRKIATTFWGESWCKTLESYSDFANRLPRGRTYARNGSIVDLQIKPGEIKALVSGSELYDIKITIDSMKSPKWKELVKTCTGQIESLIELLQGKFSKSVMEIITQPTHGLFPKPNEIKLNCSCPDWADMCKHVAAALYGVGALLDTKPEYLFTLRQVDHLDLIASVGNANNLANSKNTGEQLADDDLADIFGIEMDGAAVEISNKAPQKIAKAKKTIKPKAAALKKPASSKAKSPAKAVKPLKGKVSVKKPADDKTKKPIKPKKKSNLP